MDYALSTIVAALPGLAWESFPDGRTDSVNERWCVYTGLSAEATAQQGWRAAVHSEDRAHLPDCSAILVDPGEPQEAEVRIRSSDGSYRRFLMWTTPLRDVDGQIVKWCGFGFDIENRVRRRSPPLIVGEKRLLEMVARGEPLSAVLDTVCKLVEQATTGCYCGILFFKPGGATWQLGVGRGLPSGYNEAMHGRPAHRESGPCGLAASLKTSVIVSNVEVDTRFEKYGWSELALRHGLRACWSSPILSQSQEALGALAIYRQEPGVPSDFELELLAQLSHMASIAVERTRDEGALKRSEAFLAEAQRLSATGSFSWRVRTNELTWSKEAQRIFELEEGVPATLEQVRARIHSEDLRPLLAAITAGAAEGGDFEHEHRLQMADGAIKYLRLVAHGDLDADGQLEFVGAVQDITKRKLSEDALSRVRSELTYMSRVSTLGALTASIAHEVNQPLSGIITNANACLRMLASDPPNLDGARETVRRTIRDGNRASDVITGLRALFAKKDGTAELVDLNEAATEVLALTVNELQRSHICIHTQLADNLPSILGNRVQLQQVILNLLLNAFEATSGVDGRPKRVVLRTQLDVDERVSLSVQDAGVGIDAQRTEELFNAFYTTKAGGMGMGLSVSRSIIERHQGRLWALPNDGPGAIFSFSIPSSPVVGAPHRGPGSLRGLASTAADHNMRSRQ